MSSSELGAAKWNKVNLKEIEELGLLSLVKQRLGGGTIVTHENMNGK